MSRGGAASMRGARGAASGGGGGGGGIRGSSRGRGSRRGPHGKMLVGGEETTWEYDPEFEIDNKPVAMFPEIYIPTTQAITSREIAAIENFRRLRRQIREGPLHTIIGDDSRVHRTGQKKGVVSNPFEDMPSYTQKYKQRARTLPLLDAQKHTLHLFPRELWEVIDPKYRQSKKINTRPGIGRRTALQQTGNADGTAVTDAAADDEENEGDAVDDDVAAGADSEADPEDDFSNDDSDMGADYNAEQYFSGGEGDGDDYDDGGGGGGMDDGGID